MAGAARAPPLRQERLRELAVAVTFLWSLVIVRVTFFPLIIIFYDWHGASNLIPFASIAQLIRETPTVFAVENIVGNLVLFAPLGVLLPILFEQLRRPTSLLWRAAVISLLVEGTQFLTRARSVDIDDVILNTTGAMSGSASTASVPCSSSDHRQGVGSPDGSSPDLDVNRCSRGRCPCWRSLRSRFR